MDLRARMQDGVVLWWIWIWFRIAVDLSLVVNINGLVRVSAKCVVFVWHRWPIVETRAALFAIYADAQQKCIFVFYFPLKGICSLFTENYFEDKAEIF